MCNIRCLASAHKSQFSSRSVVCTDSRHQEAGQREGEGRERERKDRQEGRTDRQTEGWRDDDDGNGEQGFSSGFPTCRQTLLYVIIASRCFFCVLHRSVW